MLKNIMINFKVDKKEIQNNSLNLLYSILIALFIIIICNLSDRNFFFYDDAQHNYLPYLKKAGELWLNGEIPFIIKDTFISQNQIIDIDKAIFLPQNIIFSILAVKISSFVIIANIIAFTNLLIMSFFALKIGEALSIRKDFRIILSFLFCINPVILYFYLPSWWNVIGGQVWFVAALASILMLRKDFSKKYLFLNIFSVTFMLIAAWPQSIVAYFIVVLFYILELLKSKDYPKVIIFILISIGISLITVSFYSEYIISSSIRNRISGFGNFENLLNPTFNHIFMTFNPVYYNFISFFFVYRIMYIPIGYSSIYILLLLCFRNKITDLFKDNNFKFLFNLTILFFIMCQLPTQFYQIRYHFRFLPYLSEILIILSIYGIQISNLEFSKMRIKVFISIILISSLLAFFSIERDFGKIFQANIVFIILTITYLYTIIKEQDFKFLPSIIYSVFMLLLMLFVQSSIGGVLPFPGTKKNINMENNYSTGGYLLSLTNAGLANKEISRENVEDLYAAQFLYYGIKAINGYSAVGNRKLSQLLDTFWTHHHFHEENTVNNLSNKYNEEVCYFDLLKIDSIVILREKLTEDMKIKIENCGYIFKSVKNPEIIFFTKDKNNIIGNISYVSNGIFVNKILEDRSNKEKYLISSTNDGHMILSKVYWRGYRAYVNGKKVNISDEKGLIKLDNIPKGLNNATLEIRYFPVSWRYTLWLGLFGIIEIIFILIYFKKMEGKN